MPSSTNPFAGLGRVAYAGMWGVTASTWCFPPPWRPNDKPLIVKTAVAIKETPVRIWNDVARFFKKED